MANIYLRLPIIEAAFIRNRCERPLMAHEPVRYGMEDCMEWYVLNKYLTIDSSITEIADCVPPCFSQQEWNNMMRGIPPKGGHQVLKRDAHVYLNYNEVSELSGYPVSFKTRDYDYLCIEIPDSVHNTRGKFKTNASWKLTRHGVTEMLKAISDAFDYNMLQWRSMWRTHIYIHAKDILLQRRDVDMWERFLMAYDIPIVSRRQRESFKKRCQRLSDDKVLKAMDAKIKEVCDGEIVREDSKDKVLHLVN